jgi:DNA-binding beta-propeller fold protein YncE
MSRSLFLRPQASFAAALVVVTVLALSAATAWAGPGYRPDSSQASIDLAGEVPAGVAIDQSSQNVYVAEISRNLNKIEAGLVEQLSPTGQPTANSPFGTGGQDFFVAVAVDAATHGIYAYQTEAPETPVGPVGTPKVSAFSSTGTLGTSFTPANSAAETIAVDSSGRLLFPNSVDGSVQILSSSGAVEGSVTCAACPGGAFTAPQAVALDSAGKLYVVDSGGSGRVLRFSPSGSSYTYESTLQSGEGAVAVAVDSSNGNVFVGDLTGGTYHVVAYDSAGTEFDDFAAGAATKSMIEPISGQLAVNSTTHELYLTNPGGGNVQLFEPIASIPAPTATGATSSSVGQVSATLKATVNPQGHVLTSCGFEYTDHADFLVNGYANAEDAPCPAVVGTPAGTTVSASVTGLAPGTSYDFRIAVESHGGMAQSSDQSFETLPPLPPEATTGAATSVSKNGATLGGTLNPKGGTVSDCHFEYVTQAAFQSGGFSGGASKACTTKPGGNTPVAVSTKITTGLEAGTAYRFRLVATSNSGTTQATDATFTTAAETCAENPALCPPPVTPQVPSLPASVEPGPLPIAPSGGGQKKPLKCHKGFKKKRVRGKLKCVRVKKHRAKH